VITTGAVDLLERFRLAVRHSPGRTALIAPDGALDFAALEHESAVLAAALTARGVRVGDTVGVGLERGTRLVVSLLAVWRAGAAYAPLDPRYPLERITAMVRDAGIRVLIAEPEGPFAALRADADVELIAPEAVGEAGGVAAPCDVAVHPLSPAYVIFTSGSTGRPKGVSIPRGAVAELVADLEDAGIYAPQPRVVGWNASVSFDPSVQQWVRLCRGDTVVLLDEEERTDADRVAEALLRHGIQDLDMTPAHWDLLRPVFLDRESGDLDREPGDGPSTTVPRLFIGGEPLTQRAWREISSAAAEGRLEAVNLYGPTECTVDATAAWIGRAPESATDATGATSAEPHIGRELPGLRAYVLGPDLHEVSSVSSHDTGDGSGELYLAGRRLAHGYLGRPASSAVRFVADPFGGAGARMYRTGDRVRQRADGAFEFLGRVDRQVKVRGHRIELGEVESALCTHPDVDAALLTAYQDTESGTRLVAYLTGRRLPPETELRAHCATKVPGFMIPDLLVPIEAVPLTVNGKVDWSALPDPRAHAAAAPRSAAPETVAEKLIADAWAQVLGLEAVGVEDNFFALGGHSLLALRVIARLKRELGVTLRTREVYQHPELRDLARLVTERGAGAEPAA
jgi:amino acid adenylation domain-containing protein